MPTPQINAQVQEGGPQINAQVQEGGPVHQSAVERDEPQLFRGCKRSTRTWDVQIRDGNGELKRQKMRAIDVYSLPPGEKVVVEWNSRDQPVELSGGMLAQFLGHIASNCQNFPIGYEKWQKIPESYKDHVWNNIIKSKLEVNDDGHKRYIFKSLAKKWRDNRYNLYNLMKCDPDGPREANIARKPPEIPLDQWVAFVDYRARPDTKAKAEQNTINRTHQTMPHTLGFKSIARLENEMEKQLGRFVTRAELFQEDLIIRSQGSSENEAFTSVFGKEHPGYDIKDQERDSSWGWVYFDAIRGAEKDDSSLPSWPRYDEDDGVSPQIWAGVYILTMPAPEIAEGGGDTAEGS
ncbi:uncharacterized protein LOC120278524 [Dioscorea cayenensis subsp. rotundata]|uniref:Uncharacterized protein LOC120278524 n=1 Tax=Dioscorea cayennensis subsp. rotundata TaxID=55577 RepID=A0AB40CMG6_DIOCR|nr:uncharacterized protein LOC120278524 [Dioscorea cayenensis subsp. rotundata]